MSGRPRLAVAGVVLAVAVATAGCTTAARPATVTPRPQASPACDPTPGEPPQGSGQAATATPSRVRLGPGEGLSPTPANRAAGRRGGRPLLVRGVVYRQDCATPLAGATLHVWQTNPEGLYGPATPGGDVHCCYLQGTARSDGAGRYALETVMPGHYKDAHMPAHIHFEVSHPAAQGVMTELRFAGDPYLGGAEEPGTVARVTRRRGTLQASFDIVLRAR